jgi:hypothetical protein
MAMSKKEMLDYIQDRLEEASDRDVEAVYWMVVMELDG